MRDCIFCKIIKGEIPSTKVFENDKFIIIEDIEPKAKKHYLMIPKQHYAFIKDMNSEQVKDFGDMVNYIPKLQDKLGLQKGYRIVINQGESAGQTVFHLHIHILGGQELSW